MVSNRATVVVNRDMLDAIPTATRSLQARAYLIPGTTVTPVGSGQTSMTIYGSQAADQVVMVDGMRLNLLEGQGQFSGIYLNDGMAQEISYDTGAQSAEVAQGGLRVNMIPREGGNTFSGIFFIQGANGPLASDNRSDAVKAFIPQPLGLAYTYEINPSFGGPIKRDKALVLFHLQAVGHQELHDAARPQPGHAGELAELQLRRRASRGRRPIARQGPLLRRQADERPALRRPRRHRPRSRRRTSCGRRAA